MIIYVDSMKWIYPHSTIAINQKLCQVWNEPFLVKQPEILESILDPNRYIYSQIDTFEGVIWKVFVDLLTMGHPFLQANKRTAIIHTWELQRRNKVKVIYTDHKLAYALAVLIVNHKTDSMVLPQWVKTRRKLKLRRW